MNSSVQVHTCIGFFASRLWLSDFTMGIRPTLPFFDFFSLSMCPHGFLSLLLSPARLQCPILIPSDVGVTFAHRLAYVERFVVAGRLPRVCLLMCVISALHVVIKERIVQTCLRVSWLALSPPFNYA